MPSSIVSWQDLVVHPMEPIELRGDLVAIEPLRAEHAAGLLAAADSEEVFAWLPYPRPADLEQARAWIDNALADRRAGLRFPLAVLDAGGGSVIGSTSYRDFLRSEWPAAKAHLLERLDASA